MSDIKIGHTVIYENVVRAVVHIEDGFAWITGKSTPIALHRLQKLQECRFNDTDNAENKECKKCNGAKSCTVFDGDRSIIEEECEEYMSADRMLEIVDDLRKVADRWFKKAIKKQFEEKLNERKEIRQR